MSDQLSSLVIGRPLSSVSADMDGRGGTSLVVYPAAGLINYFNGKNIVLINKSSTQADSKADLIINDDIAKVMEEAVNIIKGD